MNIQIKRVRPDLFVVEWDLHGWKDAQSCDSEGEARAFVAGFMRGFNAVKNVINIGPSFDARVTDACPKEA